MKIIDAHMHFSKIASFNDCATLTSNLDYSADGYLAEAEACGIVRSVCMGLSENPPRQFPDITAHTPMLADLADVTAHTPMLADLTDTVLQPLTQIALCLGINPHTLNTAAIAEMERIVNREGPPYAPTTQIVGIKIYAGYYHFDVCDPVYKPAYDFAERHDLAVVIHSGDTYSEKGKLIYAQPLSIDSFAVDRPDMRIVICHMGAPWIYDACEVAGKNKNVYMDLSGLHVGDAAYFAERVREPLLIDRYRQALIVMDAYDKVLFGTDWPLAPMASYIDFCKRLVPPQEYDRVFYDNARRVFKLPD